MSNDTRHLTVVITSKELAALLQGKALDVMPTPGPGKLIVVDHQSNPRFRSVGGEVSCEIDFRYHVEDLPPGIPPIDPKIDAELKATTRRAVFDPPPTGGRKS